MLWNKQKIWNLTILLTAVAVVGSPVAANGGWVTTPLTFNTHCDVYPQVSGSNVVWTGGICSEASTLEIFFYDGAQTIQLTDNGYEERDPQVSGSNVVWRGLGDSYFADEYEIFLYDGTETIRLTDNDYQDWYPQVSGSHVVWSGGGGGDHGYDSEVFLHDTTTHTTTQLTENLHHDSSAQVSGSHVVWQGWDGSDYEVFLYDTTTNTTTQLTDNSHDDTYPQVSSSNVVWMGLVDAITWEVFLYDGVHTIQLTDNSYDDTYPQVSGSNVVWMGLVDGITWEIFLYDGAEIIQLTDNNYTDWLPQVSGSNVVWQGDDEGYYEIFLYDGAQTIQLTDNIYWDASAQVSGPNVVWWGYDGTDSEIFLAESTGSTPPGGGVVVEPVDETTGETPVTLTFDEVTEGGETTVTSTMPSEGQGAPQGFRFGNPPVIYEITTTATFSGDVEICFDYSGVSYGNEANLRLFHSADGTNWVDVTNPDDPPDNPNPDTINKIICGTVTSFSFFGAFELADPAELLLELAEDVMELNLQHGIENSLDGKLDAAWQALDDVNANNDVAAINALQAFINAVQGQSDKHIPEADANDLIAAVEAIIDLLNG